MIPGKHGCIPSFFQKVSPPRRVFSPPDIEAIFPPSKCLVVEASLLEKQIILSRFFRDLRFLLNAVAIAVCGRFLLVVDNTDLWKTMEIFRPSVSFFSARAKGNM